MRKYNRSIRRKTSGRKRKTSGRKRKTSGRKRKTSGRKRNTSSHKRKTSGRKNLRGGMLAAAKKALGLGGAAVPADMNPAGAALAAAEDKAEVEREIAHRVKMGVVVETVLLAGQKIMYCRNLATCNGETRVFQYEPQSHSSHFNKHWNCANEHTPPTTPATNIQWSATNPDKRIIRCRGSGCGNAKQEFNCVFIDNGDWYCTSCDLYLDGTKRDT